MKLITATALAILFSTGMVAQNKNVTNTSTTTTTTIKDSEGEKQLIRTQNTDQEQNIEFKDPNSNALNKTQAATPIDVTTTTTVTLPDGTTRVVDVDRSAIYTKNGRKYTVSLDKNGYKIGNNMKYGVLRQLSNNSYLYKNGAVTSVVYFEPDGNMVIQTYDDKRDEIITEIFEKN